MNMQELRGALKDLGFQWEPYKGGSLWRLPENKNIFILYIMEMDENQQKVFFVETTISINIVDASDVKLALNKIFENAKRFLEAYKETL